MEEEVEEVKVEEEVGRWRRWGRWRRKRRRRWRRKTR